MRGKLARQPTVPTGPFANGNGVYGTALWNGNTDTVFTKTVTETDTDERERNAGNKALPASSLGNVAE